MKKYADSSEKAYFMPFSVRSDGSNCKILFSKNCLVISGSKSGSSPIS